MHRQDRPDTRQRSEVFEQANARGFSMQLRPETHTCARPDRTSNSDTRPSTLPTLTWGVSDPAGRPRGRGMRSRAGSLTPLPCCDTCAGALTGRHKPPPVLAPPGRRQHRLLQWSCGASVSAVALECMPVGKSPPLRDGGPTAPWPCVSLLGPLRRRTNRHGDDDGRVSARP